MSTANLPGAAGLTQALVPALTPAGRPRFLARIESWFRRSTVGGRAAFRGRFDTLGALDADRATPSDDPRNGRPTPATHRAAARSPRPWAGRRSGRPNVQNGFGKLAGVMTDIRDNLERQSARQEELLRSLAHLPEASRLQGEATREALGALDTIQGQIERQGAQQWQVAEILERISRADAEQGRVLDALCRHESSFSEGLTRVGDMMQTVGATSEAGARVLEQLRDSIHARDGELERAFKSHNARLTTLLSIAIGLSAAAMASAVAMAVAGFLLLHRIH